MLSKHFQIAALATAAAIAFVAPPAKANFVITTDVSALSQGFGNVPRLLTLQGQQSPPNSAEVACNANVGGSLVQGAGANPGGTTSACLGSDAAIQGNGYANTETAGTPITPNTPSGTPQVPSGQGANLGDVNGNNQNNLVTLSSLGITDASQIRLNYNPSQQGADPGSRIQDITLKFYDSSNNLVTSIDGGCGFATSCYNTINDLFFSGAGTNLGNGGVGFILTLTASEVTALNAACGANFVNCKTVAGEATISNNNDGPDSFTLFSSALAVPEPTSLAIFGAALAGLGLLGRRRRKNV